MDDNIIKRVGNHMSPKVILERLNIPLNATIKVKEVSSPSSTSGKNFLVSYSEGDKNVTEDIPISHTKRVIVHHDLSEESNSRDSVEILPKASEDLLKSVRAGSNAKVPSGTVMKMMSSRNKMKKSSPGTVVKKVPAGAFIKKLPVNNKHGTKIKMLSIGAKTKRKGPRTGIRNGTLHKLPTNINSRSKLSDSDLEEIETSVTNRNEKVVSNNSAEPQKELSELGSDVKSLKVELTSASDSECGVTFDEPEEKLGPAQANVSAVNSRNKKIRKVRRRSSNALTPVRISARLKNRKEKFSVKKLLDGTNYFDRYTQKKQVIHKPKQGVPLSVKVNKLASKFHMRQTQFVKNVLAAREKLKINQEKMKFPKASLLQNLDFPVELGPDITVTRVKNSKSGTEIENKKKELSTLDIITITEGRPDSKKVNSVSKVTQTYTNSKVKEDKNEISTPSDDGNNVKSRSCDIEELGETGAPEVETREFQKSKQQKRFNRQQIVEVNSLDPGQNGMFSQGKKTAKVTPLTQVKGPMNESPSPKTNELVNKVKPIKFSKFSVEDDEDDDDIFSFIETKTDRPPGPGRPPKMFKRKLENSFEKYFVTKTRICEHNDSLESDSEEEVKLLSHFVHPKKNETLPLGQTPVKEEVQETPKKETTIYELIQDIAAELPAWNLHILEDTNSFCITHVARGPVGIPVMKKIIEIDSDYNAKVYVNQAFRSEFHGVYNTYESIRDLILKLDKL